MWFGFDPLGRCVKRWVGPSGDPNTTTAATYFYYDGSNLRLTQNQPIPRNARVEFPEAVYFADGKLIARPMPTE
jgi:hypothetical protein